MNRLTLVPIILLVVVNLIAVTYLDLILKKEDKSNQSRILIRLIYPLLGICLSVTLFCSN
ncbi:hypothetical protein KS664_001428 [Clostridium perfringens]|nr:hypothetical protein [Clostridium perfringens]